MCSFCAETLGFVVIESLSSGVPVVASRAGGIPDIIKEGDDVANPVGVMYAPGNLDEATRHIQYLLDNPEKRLDMGTDLYEYFMLKQLFFFSPCSHLPRRVDTV